MSYVQKFRDFRVPQKYLLENHYHGKKLTYIIIGLACLSIFFFGYDQGMMSGVNNSPDYVRIMKFGHWDDTGAVLVTDSTKQGGIVAIYYFGTLWGCLFGGYFSDEFGRVKSIALGALVAIIGAALQGSAQNVSWMVGSRFFTGIGTGILNAVVPVYSSETAEATSRGAYICFEFTLNIFGVVVAYWLEFGLSYIGMMSSFRWRFPIFFQIIPLVFLFFVVWLCPESPRFLVKVGETERALTLLRKLRGDKRGAEEFEEIQEAFNYEKDSALSTNYVRMFFDLYKGSKEAVRKAKKLHIARRVQLVIWLQIMQEWIGIAGITVYQTDIFRQAGFDARKSQWIAGLNNTFYMLSTLVAVVTIDRWGRRFVNFWGLSAMAVCMFLAGGLSRAQQLHPDNKSWGAAATAFVFMYTSVFGASLLMTPWILPSEIFPLKLRAAGNAAGVVGWSIGNGWLMLMCPIMFDSIHEKTLYIFGACNIILFIMVYFLYPETANRTLEDIDFLFASESWLASKCEEEFQRTLEERKLGKNIVGEDFQSNESLSKAEFTEVEKLSNDNTNAV